MPNAYDLAGKSERVTGGAKSIGTAIAELLRDYSDAREPILNGLNRPVFGRIVEHGYLDGHFTREASVQRIEAGEKQLAAVRVDDRDGDLAQRASPRAMSAAWAASTASEGCCGSSQLSRSFMPRLN